MKETHPLFGPLEYDDYLGYTTSTTVLFSGKKTEVELIISETLGNGGIEEIHCDTYNVLIENWEEIVPDVLQAIIKYQNTEWGASDHTQSFPMFKTMNDVLENVELIRITLEAGIPEYRKQEGRYVVLLFSAEWVNNDYRLLSVALINEKVVEVTDQDV